MSALRSNLGKLVNSLTDPGRKDHIDCERNAMTIVFHSFGGTDVNVMMILSHRYI